MKKIGIYKLLICSFFLVATGVYCCIKVFNGYYEAPIPTVKSIVLDENNKLVVKFDLSKSNFRSNVYYILKTDNTIPEVDDIGWTISTNNQFSFLLDRESYFVYLKNADGKIIKVENIDKFGRVTNLKINKEKIYVAIKGTYTPTLTYDKIGRVTEEVKWTSDDESIAKVDANGKITGVKKGTTKINAEIMGEKTSTEVLVTNLITVRPKKYNSKKPYLKCGIYSEADNDLLDEILKDRINDAGYKTRAGVVEAARFLALEFPYKIRYFSENGRGSTNGVDGEGRYYHIGLYLHSSRFKNIRKTSAGPQTWGCQLYSRPSHGKRANGFDCSGFVSWVLLNGGFDVGDIGAGLAPHKDLTDYGVRTKFNYNVVTSGKVKVGDLLSSGGVQGGHIAIIVGEDNDYYYVAESLWTPPNVAVVIIPYSKKTLFNRYYYVMLMDSYYKEDGNLTKMWY